MSVQTDFYEMPAGSYEPGLRLIHGDANNSAATTIKSGLSRAWNWITSHAATAWNWTKSTLHLQGFIDWAKNTTVSTMVIVRKVGSAMGVGGSAGAGMLLVSTSGGHKVLHYLVGVPMGFIAKWVGNAWHKVEDFHTDNLGGYGNWVAGKMQDLEYWLLGEDRVSGVVGKITGFYIKHVASHLMLGSILMRTVRLAGTILFGVAVVNALPLFLAGGALTIAVYVVGGATIGFTGWQGYHLGYAIGSVPAFANWLNQTRTASNRAARVATSTVNGVNIASLVEDMEAKTAASKNPNVRSTKNASVK